MTLNNDAWQKLFERYHILDEIRSHGEYIISANQIKTVREPRLMVKFDHKVNLPSIFQENNLAILPISRGDYVISSFFAYNEFEDFDAPLHQISIPQHLQSLMPKYLISETIALNCAYACNVLADFLEDDDLTSTVNGRMSSGNFSFQINTAYGSKCIAVRNAQIEIDAAYEGVQYLSLFEAKRDISKDFLIRQLYYPFRAWSNRVTKPVKSIFLVFSNGVFYLKEYRFADPKNYNSLFLVKQINYKIETHIFWSDIENLLKNTSIECEPDFPFPQADSMSRIINLFELLYNKPRAKQEITTIYDFNERQTGYYVDAGRYLGIIEKQRNENGQICFQLSPLGQHIMALEYQKRQLSIVEQILKHHVFNKALKIYLQCGEMPSKQTIIQIMKEYDLYHVKADSTYQRRSATVMSWINWILSIVDKS